MLHNVLILRDLTNPLGAHIIVDDKEVEATSFRLSQSVNELPVLRLEMRCIDEVDRECAIEIDGLDSIAKIMDKKELNSFIELWRKYHSEGE